MHRNGVGRKQREDTVPQTVCEHIFASCICRRVPPCRERYEGVGGANRVVSQHARGCESDSEAVRRSTDRG